MEIKSRYKRGLLLSKKSTIELTEDGWLVTVTEYLPIQVLKLIKENMFFIKSYEKIEKYESENLIVDIFLSDKDLVEHVDFRFYNGKTIAVPDFLKLVVKKYDLLFFTPKT